ncbi:50S ribosomal protein L35 [Bacteriovoracaceae bacterium]|nr:50S ribosomal protein L35 [Bacteriovoracaceae bacterium]
MPKMKTKRSAAKRFSLTATGKIKIKKANLRHILTKRSRSLKRDKRAIGYVHKSDVKRTMAMLPGLK